MAFYNYALNSGLVPSGFHVVVLFFFSLFLGLLYLNLQTLYVVFYIWKFDYHFLYVVEYIFKYISLLFLYVNRIF